MFLCRQLYFYLRDVWPWGEPGAAASCIDVGLCQSEKAPVHAPRSGGWTRGMNSKCNQTTAHLLFIPPYMSLLVSSTSLGTENSKVWLAQGLGLHELTIKKEKKCQTVGF